jgi:D-beta-D-heptose 7-phosphate kinase/D-beta-D-heptose 1-phosphate adenosyltransferase
METPKIYESPDGGKTIYARDFGQAPAFRVLVKSPEKRVVLVTGGFDPLHSGHLAYFKAAKALGDTLVVGINSDSWLKRKKGRSFYTWNERFQLIKNLEMVDYVIEFNDDENNSINAIKQSTQTFPGAKIIFANGGDRTAENIPEMGLLDDIRYKDNLEFVFSVGGDNKMNSSSWILEEWKAPKTSRAWGYYRVLHEQGKEIKVKELTVGAKTCLSMQRHKDRAEHWFVAEGTATVYTLNAGTDMDLVGTYNKFESLHINKEQWHKLCNETDEPLRVIEIQYGENCIEEDIERK